jgi:hypothetical protein
MVAVASTDGDREPLFSKIVPRGEKVVVTVETEDSGRERTIVKVWREKTMPVDPTRK